MAEVTKIGIEIEASTANNQNIKSLKAQLREAIQEAQILSQQDLGSAQAVAAQKKVAQLRDAIDDTNERIQSFTGAGQFKAFGNAVQAVAGGFAAAQGAMALFGSESEDLQKTLVKLNGAIALSQGLAALEGAKDSFGSLGKLITSKVVPAFTTLRGAIIATGIGAIAVAVGTLAANWKEFIGFLENSFPAFKQVTDFFSNFKQVAMGTVSSIVEGFKVVGDVVAKIFDGDFSGAIDSAKGFGERVARAYNEGYIEEDKRIKREAMLAQRKFELDLAEAQGKDIRAKRIKLLQEELKDLEKGSEDYNKKLIEIENIRTDIRNDANEKRKEAEEKYRRDIEAYAKEADERMKILEEERKKRFEEDMYAQIEAKKIEDELFAQMNRQQFEDAQKSYDAQQAALKKQSEEKINLRLAELDNEKAVTNEITSLAGSLTDLIGANAETQKKIASASALIETFQATQTAFTQAQKSPTTIAFPAYPYVIAAATIASGLARVKAINSVNPRGGGSGSSAPATPPPPQFTPAAATQVQGAGDINLSNQPKQANRVYVVESDIRNTMNKVDVIERNRTIGG